MITRFFKPLNLENPLDKAQLDYQRSREQLENMKKDCDAKQRKEAATARLLQKYKEVRAKRIREINEKPDDDDDASSNDSSDASPVHPVDESFVRDQIDDLSFDFDHDPEVRNRRKDFNVQKGGLQQPTRDTKEASLIRAWRLYEISSNVGANLVESELRTILVHHLTVLRLTTT